MPVDVLTEISANQGRNQRAEIDPHIEDRKPGIAAHIVLAIEIADHGADVRFQQASAEDDDCETRVESWQRGDSHREVPEGNDDAAPQNRLALASDPVRQPPAGQAEQEDHGGVKPVDRAGFRNGEVQSAFFRFRDHEQNEESAHPVIAETLPHLGEEESGEAARVTEE